MKSLVELFVDVDDFWKANRAMWHKHQLESGARQRIREKNLSESEIMTIMILFHQSGYREFKDFYLDYVCEHLVAEFPGLVSYSRFVRFQSEIGMLLFWYLRSCLGTCSGISFVDSTPLAVCHNRRIGRHKVFDGFAQRGKSTMGWFYGFKLHVIVNDRGELLDFALTAGNVDDRHPIPDLVRHVFGKLFGDKGYLSKTLRETLWEQGVDLITTVRSNMKPQIMLLSNRLLLRKRFIIETINDQLKNISQIEHTRHRSINNFVVNLIAGLVAYCHQPNKPAIQFESKQLKLRLEN